MHHLPPSPPPPLPATDQALHAASAAFEAGHRMPLVAREHESSRAPCIARPGGPLAPGRVEPDPAQG